MVQLLFARLPQFKDETVTGSPGKQFKDLSTKDITTNNSRLSQQLSGSEEKANGRNFYCIIIIIFVLIYLNNRINFTCE